MAYGPNGLVEQDATPADLPSIIGDHDVTWVDVQGVGDVELLTELGQVLGIHPLALEDVANTTQRPKVEEYDEQVFLVLRMVRTGESRTEQLALFLTDRAVVTFQEEPGDVFDGVRERLRKGRARIRGSGADYLAYALLDAAVDGWFPVLDSLAERLDQLDDEVMDRRDEHFLLELHRLRRDVKALRRDVWPLRAMLGQLVKGELPNVGDTAVLYLRDCLDHATQLIDACEAAREQASGLIEVALGLASQRMNDIMKVLTIMASLFIPLTFIAGIYGMNFDPEASPWNMPELRSAWGYPLVMLAMAAVTVGMLLFFRRRGWIGETRTRASSGEAEP